MEISTPEAAMRNFHLKIYDANIPAQEHLCAAFVTATVCEEKVHTQLAESTNKPRWHWAHTFTNARSDCRIKLAIYADQTPDSPDRLGSAEMTVGEFLHGKEDMKQTVSAGDCSLTVSARWE
ncbi:hypothetical protein JK359_32145 [Streptomyces actinomycinicus]|uniref:C2 domain-containing protein n=1 Tax=Streptomyces actinomycinicus TaxID=1695166 RepID=A0A937ENG6_9ACTN|nr:hypothetical protein [Streptomyces actinomycinicus]MBL1086557.1 hypothetical protein [Streptomyces actinomycinicus]